MTGLDELPKVKLEIWEKPRKLGGRKRVEKFFVSNISDFSIISPI